jgi:hypothetical protein
MLQNILANTTVDHSHSLKRMRILDQFPIQLSFRPNRLFNPVPLIAMLASYARKTISNETLNYTGLNSQSA